MSPSIRLPHDWNPRPHQMALWRYLEGGGKRAVAVWHRRAGKDSTALNISAVAAHQRPGVYWHMLPTLRQARKVVWNGIDRNGRRMIDQAFPRALRDGKANETEMAIRLACGSLWQLLGSDNYDSFVGANPVGVVFSEWSLANPSAWEYVRPILAENGGWAVFVYTPRGRNHGHSLFERARRTPGWFAERLGVDDTGVIPASAIAEDRRAGMPEELIEQEYYCSFQAALVGAYYGKQLVAAEREGRIGCVPWDPALPVETAWDLGLHDATAIWFAQTAGQEVRIIDYLEGSGAGLDHYVKALAGKPYVYGDHVLPHDVEVRELGTGRSRRAMLRALGLSRVRVLPQADSVADGIQAVRTLLPRCWFDAERCATGLEALRQYQRDWDDDRKCYKERPRHDWTSHAADAFRYLATGLRPAHSQSRPRFAST